jgi:hypothetical protein
MLVRPPKLKLFSFAVRSKATNGEVELKWRNENKGSDLLVVSDSQSGCWQILEYSVRKATSLRRQTHLRDLAQAEQKYISLTT